MKRISFITAIIICLNIIVGNCVFAEDATAEIPKDRNVALGKNVTAALGKKWNGETEYLVDGNTNTLVDLDGECAYWQIDLGDEYALEKITLYSQGTADIQVSVAQNEDFSDEVIVQTFDKISPYTMTHAALTDNKTKYRYVRIKKVAETSFYMVMQEVYVYAAAEEPMTSPSPEPYESPKPSETPTPSTSPEPSVSPKPTIPPENLTGYKWKENGKSTDNAAFEKRAYASGFESTPAYTTSPDKAVDGKFGVADGWGVSGSNSWLAVDLGKREEIRNIAVQCRTAGEESLKNFELHVSNSEDFADYEVVLARGDEPSETATYTCDVNLDGRYRYVRYYSLRKNAYNFILEFMVMTANSVASTRTREENGNLTVEVYSEKTQPVNIIFKNSETGNTAVQNHQLESDKKFSAALEKMDTVFVLYGEQEEKREQKKYMVDANGKISISLACEGVEGQDIIFLLLPPDTEGNADFDINAAIDAVKMQFDEQGSAAAEFWIDNSDFGGQYIVYAYSTAIDFDKNAWAVEYADAPTKDEVVNEIITNPQAGLEKYSNQYKFFDIDTVSEFYQTNKTQIVNDFTSIIGNGQTCEEILNAYEKAYFKSYVSSQPTTADILLKINDVYKIIDDNIAAKNDEFKNNMLDIFKSLNSNTSDMNTAYKQSYILASVNSASVTTLKEIIDKYTSLSYTGVNETKLFSAVLPANKQSYYKTMTEFETAFNAAKTRIINENTGSGTGKSTGGGGGGIGGPLINPRPAIDNNVTNPEAENIADAFSDIGNVEWAREAINYFAEKEIIKGKEKGKFYPNDNVTRAEFITMALRAFNLYENGLFCKFDDVSEGAWYYTYVACGYNLGIIKGIDEDLFNPEGYITREDVSAIILRCINYLSNDISADEDAAFDDFEIISDYAKEAVSYLYSKKIVSGAGDNRFEPARCATRAEAVKIIYTAIMQETEE